MAKPEFLQETKESYDGVSLADLEHHIKEYLGYLMGRELETDEFVYEDLLTLLALRLMHAEKSAEGAEDSYQKFAAESLREDYTAIFRNPKATDQWMFIYCADQRSHYADRNEEERAKRWDEIAEAVERVIQGVTALDKQIAVEIAERAGDPGFLADEWRRLRKVEALEPAEITDDLCHV